MNALLDFLVSISPYIGLVLGVAGRVFIPWYVERIRSGEIEWDSSKAMAQLATGALMFLALLAANPDLTDLGWQAALAIGLGSALTGWGVSDIGREVKKANDYRKIENHRGRIIR